ncbi:CrcB family protein [uncultured Bifidobacterium sp.]|uniref:fluoride efflux transporter FluC n=1 Tax=uncultured Bifidobacterium sp. TaxID=165187 RepID=UPI00280B3AD7|nr:CrcB family protein [uncultured Bifidobacterium sp.]
MESQKRKTEDGPAEVNAGTEPNPATQSIDINEVAHASVHPSGVAASKNPPQIPLAPMKRVQARFNPLADVVMYVVVFVGGFFGVGCRHVLDMLMPSVGGTPFVVGTFVSNMVACFLFAMLAEYMATASWLRRRVRQGVSRGVGLGFLGGLSTMSGVMLETMEGLHEQRFAAAFGYLAGSFVCGLIASAAGMALMRVVTSHGIRKRVRAALADASVSDSGESDIRSNAGQPQMSDSGESDTQGEQGVRHVKVADAAHSAAQAALEAAQTAQQAAQIAQQAAQTGQVPRIVSAVGDSAQSARFPQSADDASIASLQTDSFDQAGPVRTDSSANPELSSAVHADSIAQSISQQTVQADSDVQSVSQQTSPLVSRDVSRDIHRMPVPQLEIPQLSATQLPDSSSSLQPQSQASVNSQSAAHENQVTPQRTDSAQFAQPKRPAQPAQSAQPKRSAQSQQTLQSAQPHRPNPQQSQQSLQSANPPSFEPKPITAQIPLVADPTTGEVR